MIFIDVEKYLLMIGHRYDHSGGNSGWYGVDIPGRAIAAILAIYNAIECFSRNIRAFEVIDRLFPAIDMHEYDPDLNDARHRRVPSPIFILENIMAHIGPGLRIVFLRFGPNKASRFFSADRCFR